MLQKTAENPRHQLQTKSRQSIGYLVSRYPAVSHTFILREVLGLKEQGIDVSVASINTPDRATDEMDVDEAAEERRTFYVKGPWSWVLFTLVKEIAGRPWAIFRGLAYAMRLGGTDAKKALYSAFYAAEAVIVGRWLRLSGLEHLHVHFATPAATVGLIVKHIYGTGLSFTLHGPDEFDDVPGFYLREKIEKADFVCCIGYFARSQLMRLSPHDLWDRFEITRLGVDPNQFAPAERSDHRTINILCVGRLVPAKGQHILLQAFADLREAGRDIRLTFVGTGPDETSLKRLADQRGVGDSVVFRGALNQPEVKQTYAESDLFVLPSFAEGIPVVLMEAMACGLPCVSTRITGIPELIRHETDGLLVSASDHVALRDQIDRLLGDRELRKRLGSAGRRRVMDAYDLGANIDRLAGVFRRRMT